MHCQRPGYLWQEVSETKIPEDVRAEFEEALLAANKATLQDIIASSREIITCGDVAGQLLIPTLARIGERMRDAEKELDDERERIAVTLRSIGEGVITTDISGQILLMNKIASDLTGWPEGEAIGKPLCEVFNVLNEATTERCHELVDWALGNGHPATIDNPTTLTNRHGDEISVTASASAIRDKEGGVHGVVLVFRDVTERKRARERLRRSQERFAKAFNASPSLMAIVSLHSGKFIDVNNAFLTVTGYAREEIIGQTGMNLNIFSGKADYHKISNTILEEGAIRSTETGFFTKNGEERFGLISAELIDVSGDKCILGCIQDITEREHFRREIARLDRLNSMKELAATIAHEIRNPLTTVSGFLQVLRTKSDFGGYKEYFDLMIEEINRANSIITEFLSLAKDKEIALKRQNLNAIVRALSPLIITDGINLNMNILMELGEVPDLLLDEKEIRQLILNLVRNGLEAMSPPGTLTIRTFREGEEVVMAVHDQGPGIEPGLIKKMGTPFFTTKENGTGLGLAVCYSIAIRHNATIQIETGEEGTTFLVRFRF